MREEIAAGSPPLSASPRDRRRAGARRRRRPRRRCRRPRSRRRGCSTADPTRRSPNAVVLVQGSQILAAGAGARRAGGREGHRPRRRDAPAGIHRLHTHLTGESRRQLRPDFFDGLRRPITEQVFYGAEYARKTLEAGFTTVRDVGSTDDLDVGLRNAINGRPDPRARACWSRATPSAPPAATATTRAFRRTPSAPSRASSEGILHGADEGRAGRAPRRQVRRGRDQDVRLGRRALARRRRVGPSAHRGRARRRSSTRRTA